MQPLGTRGQTHVQQATLSPEDMVVLSTNGLVSNPAKGLRQSSEDFGSIGARVLDESADRGSSPSQRADDVGRALVAGYEPAGPCDDVALLVALRVAAPRLLSVEMSVDTFDVGDLRARLSDWLDELGAGLADHISLGHAMVELATNVAKHAYPDSSQRARPIRISAMLDDAGDVVATVSDQGRWRVPDEQHGRGLTMAGGLMDSLRVQPLAATARRWRSAVGSADRSSCGAPRASCRSRHCPTSCRPSRRADTWRPPVRSTRPRPSCSTRPSSRPRTRVRRTRRWT